MIDDNKLPNVKLKQGDLFLVVDFGSTVTKFQIIQYKNNIFSLTERQDLLSDTILSAKDPDDIFLKALGYVSTAIGRILVEDGMVIVSNDIKTKGVSGVYFTGNPEVKNRIRLLEHFSFTSTEEVVSLAEGTLTSFYPHLNYVDIGSQYSRFGYYEGDKWQTIFAHGGVGSGFKNVLPTVVSFEKTFQWMPDMTLKDEIEDYIGNKVAYAHMIPGSIRDLMIEHALLRVTMRKYRPKSFVQTARDGYILLTGGAFSGLAHQKDVVLIALDGLEPYGVQTLLWDPQSMVNALILLGQDYFKALKRTLESVSNPLQTVAVTISLMGSEHNGEKIGKVLCDFGLDEKMEIPLVFGDLLFIPNDKREVDLSFFLKKSVELGKAENSRQKSSIVKTRGDGMGIIIDTRGRPFEPPLDNPEGKQQLNRWQHALSELELIKLFKEE